jgi:hypothetical protein
MTAPGGYYLAEWYRAELTEPATDHVVARLVPGSELAAADGTVATVVVSLAVPSDGVIFCVFAAESHDAVARACAHEGIPTERITEAFVGAVPA